MGRNKTRGDEPVFTSGEGQNLRYARLLGGRKSDIVKA